MQTATRLALIAALLSVAGVAEAAKGSRGVVDARLRQLRTASYVTLPRGTFMPKALQKKLRRVVFDPWFDSDTFKVGRGASYDSLAELRADERVEPELRGLASFIERSVTRPLQRALPGESFELRRVDLRREGAGAGRFQAPHVDRYYLSVVFPFGYDATQVFERNARGKVVVKQGPRGSTTILTARYREAATGIEAKVHRGPRGVKGRRALLQVIYQVKNPHVLPKAFRAKLGQRTRQIAQDAHLKVDPAFAARATSASYK